MENMKSNSSHAKAQNLAVRLSAHLFSGARDSVPNSWTCGSSQLPRLVSQSTRALTAASTVLLFALLAHGQPLQSPASASSHRITFGQSILEISTAQQQFAPGPSATLVRSELSPAEAQTTLDFSVALKMHNLAELRERTSKGQTISLDELAAKYYPTAAEYKAAGDWLIAQGFAVKPSDKYNLSVFVHGSVAQIERAFGMKFGRIEFEGSEYTSALTAPSLPTAVAAPVLGINGLQPHLHPRSHLIKVTPSQRMQKFTNNQPPYTVAEIARAYGADGSNVNGAGQKIGIVIDTFPADSDLTLFWNANAVSQSLSNIEKVQVVAGTLPSPSGEETLDVEWSSSVAPGAKVRVYATTALDYVYLDQAYQAIINDLPSQPGLHQISLSYGSNELSTSVSQMQTDDQYFAALAGAGVTVFVSSGDGGSSPGASGHDHSGAVQVESPANDPNVTAVGGTSLYLNGSTGAVSSETAWYDGGGGISTIFGRPSWQTGPGISTGSTRLVPDVALVADPNTGGILFLGGVEYWVGGTSWSAPDWAGFCALINQAGNNLGRPPVGLLGPKIYPLIGTSNFRDIITGSNGPNGVYNAGPGYDLDTGVGVPNMAALIATLAQPAPTHVAKDFNGDGFADLVWENTTTGQRSIWLLKNGVFSSLISLPTEPVQWHIAGVGDFNGDGNADLVWENTSTGQHTIWFLKNGVFSSFISLPTEPVQWHIAGVGDFNGDGFADLVWENTTTGQHTIWFLKNGVFSSFISLPTEPVQWHVGGAGDFNGDGFADLVWENTSTGQHTIWFLENGVFSSFISLPTQSVQWHVEDH
ncbi:MAG: FG-GAP repeat protein [Verrucomicrobia bacterium]|nr:FG-GAP repeat protein [Verrucomicrobiota bacterium]